jgi:hypothetical protein
MYFKQTEIEEKPNYSTGEILGVVISVVLVLLLGLLPGSLIDLITSFL